MSSIRELAFVRLSLRPVAATTRTTIDHFASSAVILDETDSVFQAGHPPVASAEARCTIPSIRRTRHAEELGRVLQFHGDDDRLREHDAAQLGHVCPSDKPNVSFYDGDLANKTAAQISQARTPWFIAAGLRRPHRPWHVPRWAYAFYANNGTDPLAIPVAKHKTGPKGMPEFWPYIHNVWPAGVITISITRSRIALVCEAGATTPPPRSPTPTWA